MPASTSLYEQLLNTINTYPDEDEYVATTAEAMNYLGLSNGG